MELRAEKNFDPNGHPFLSNIFQKASPHSDDVPVEKRPYTYFITHPSFVVVLNGFKECGYRFVSQQYDSTGGTGNRVTMER